MNGLFVAQGASIRLFHELMRRLQIRLGLGELGFYVAGSGSYLEFVKRFPEVESGEVQLLKEWYITRDATKLAMIDDQALRRYEGMLGELWPAVVLDRRLLYGRSCKYEQNYDARFDHDMLKKIILTGLTRIEQLFENVRPDFVIAFMPATFGGYLIYLFAKARRIPYFQLKSAKILDYVMLSTSIMERPGHIYERFYSGKISDSAYVKAGEYLAGFRDSYVGYDGNTRASAGASAPVAKPWRSRVRRFLQLGWRYARPGTYLQCLRATRNMLREALEFYRSERAADNYNWDPVLARLYLRYVQRWRQRVVDRRLQRIYVRKDELEIEKYVYFPLHTEPEIALSCYARPYLNQIEVVRNLAQSVPFDMKIYVKEHPRQLGKRKVSYYRKLLNIPNVRLIDPYVNPHDVMRHCTMVATISGFAGFEGVMLKKPAITFGNCTFNVLSSVRHVTDLYELSRAVSWAVSMHQHDEEELLRLLAAIIDGSAPISLYGKLLNWSVPLNGLPEFDRLVEYTLQQLAEQANLAVSTPCAPTDFRLPLERAE